MVEGQAQPVRARLGDLNTGAVVNMALGRFDLELPTASLLGDARFVRAFPEPQGALRTLRVSVAGRPAPRPPRFAPDRGRGS